MNHSKLISSLLAAAVLPFGAAACGGSSSSPATGSVPKVTIGDNGIAGVPGDKPVSTEILIDRTALRHSNPELADAYKQAALQAAAPTITRGGNVDVRVFGRVAAHSTLLYSASIPSLAQAGDGARDDNTQTAELSAALNIAVGLTPPPTSAAAALAQVTKVEGSDIGSAVGDAITGLVSDPAPTHDIVLETDGWIVRQAQPPLSRVLAQRGATRAADLIVNNADVPAGTRPVSLLEIEGLGSTAGHNDPGAQTIQHLDQAYHDACARLPVKTCVINSGS